VVPEDSPRSSGFKPGAQPCAGGSRGETFRPANHLGVHMAAEIFDVIRAGNAERLRQILSTDRSQAATRNERGHSPVLIAQYHRKKDLVDLLLAVEPDLDIFDAASVGRPDRVKELLDQDPSRLNAWSSDGFTPLHLAAFFGFPRVVEVLLA